MDYEKLGFGTRLQHFGEEDKTMGAVTPPIYQNSLFVFEQFEDLHNVLSGLKPETTPVYSRVSNPTLDIVERKIAHLEGAEACKVAGSGMAAAAWGIFAAANQGGHIVGIKSLYGPTKELLEYLHTKFGITHTLVDGRETSNILDAVRPETSLICLESPSSVLMHLQDIEAVTRYAREARITTLIDNTHASPLYQQPHALGVDLVMHTATKYLSGHSDLVAGALTGSKAQMASITRYEVALLGSILNPLGAWLLHRGLRTLEIRIKRHEETANLVADWLYSHPSVERINHVSHHSFPQRELYLKQMTGSAGLFSWLPKTQDKKKIFAFVDALNVFQRGVSWGGFESLCIASHITHDGREPYWLIRCYCGLETPQDLIADLQQAFEVSGL
ncbi:MAG: PLP-dependent transferase [Armatimonadetes bacterium]|nr:PLP-dependent transferase [Armatimonadota bacterium]